jgi:hypothetical protein
MHDVNYEDEELMRRLGGKYVAWLDGQVLLTAETYDELGTLLDQLPRDQEERAIVEYIEPYDVVRVY